MAGRAECDVLGWRRRAGHDARRTVQTEALTFDLIGHLVLILVAVAIVSAVGRSITLTIFLGGTLLIWIFSAFGFNNNLDVLLPLLGVAWIGAFVFRLFMEWGYELDLVPSALTIRHSPSHWALVGPLGGVCTLVGNEVLHTVFPALFDVFRVFRRTFDVTPFVTGDNVGMAQAFLFGFLPNVAHDVLVATVCLSLILVPLAGCGLAVRRLRTGTWT